MPSRRQLFWSDRATVRQSPSLSITHGPAISVRFLAFWIARQAASVSFATSHSVTALRRCKRTERCDRLLLLNLILLLLLPDDSVRSEIFPLARHSEVAPV